MSKDRKTAFFNALQELGFRPETDADGDIRFRYEGSFMYVGLPSDDAQFMSISDLWSESFDPGQRIAALEIANELNGHYKVNKFQISEHGLVVSAETLSDDVKSCIDVLMRKIHLVRSGSNDFFQRYRSTATKLALA